jgi:hypothetical protein
MTFPGLEVAARGLLSHTSNLTHERAASINHDRLMTETNRHTTPTPLSRAARTTLSSRRDLRARRRHEAVVEAEIRRLSATRRPRTERLSNPD